MHSTVTILIYSRLFSINQSLKPIIMRTLNSNQVSEKLTTSKGFTWNSKRRYR